MHKTRAVFVLILILPLLLLMQVQVPGTVNYCTVRTGPVFYKLNSSTLEHYNNSYTNYYYAGMNHEKQISTPLISTPLMQLQPAAVVAVGLSQAPSSGCACHYSQRTQRAKSHFINLSCI